MHFKYSSLFSLYSGYLSIFLQTFSQQADEAPDTTPGDLIFRIVTAPHKRFVRQGDNLHFSLTISLLEVYFHFSLSF
jgi:DnaJ-class molecular chaperone